MENKNFKIPESFNQIHGWLLSVVYVVGLAFNAITITVLINYRKQASHTTALARMSLILICLAVRYFLRMRFIRKRLFLNKFILLDK
jgi:hypothetical protein